MTVKEFRYIKLDRHKLLSLQFSSFKPDDEFLESQIGDEEFSQLCISNSTLLFFFRP